MAVANSSSDLLALLGLDGNTTEVCVYSVRLIEVAGVLADHLERLAEGRVRFSVHGVHVTGSVDVWSGLVQSRVDSKAGSVNGHSVAANDISVLVDLDHVLGLEKTKMDTQRVDPKSAWVHRVSDGDVSRASLSVALASENSEGPSHVF
ncbi:hypothetical protein OGATHE_005561 [Ogataea polymorpha]|uniref:Uncharacterized protein n=1 Tax=Ogataea polymorpha TaxID=460523 RepID=A0A9P8NUK2_9ASCO|nr:hypothetical protein OGATHE_005561 [Ogataea polymorpha]